MRSIWFTVIFAASSWLYLLSTFTPAKTTLFVPFVFPLLLAAAAGTFSFKKNHSFNSKYAAWFVIPLVLVIFLIPYPYNIGAIVLLAGFFICILSMRIKAVAPLSGGLLITGLILLFQTAATPVYYILSSRVHEIKLLNILALPLLRMFGLDVGISEGVIFLPTYENMLAFPGLLEKFGFYMLLHVLLGGIILLTIFDRRLKSFFKFFTIIALYGYLRYVVLIFIYKQVDDAIIYWLPEYLILSFIPLAAFLAGLMPLGKVHEYTPPPSHYKSMGFSPKGMTAGILAFMGIFFLIGIPGFHDPGVKKSGRILIDEKHSNWEWTTQKFDTSWFGSKSTYNYYCLAQYLDHFYSVDYNFKKLTKKTLSQYDVVILKTPTQAYEPDEIENIVEFVEKGGGLWLIGDHTNIFGMSYYMNFIAKRFGLFFNYDSTYDLYTGKLTRYEPPAIFPHPIVQNMPPFLYATSCTLDAPLTSQNVMIGYGLRSRLLAYSERGFFEQRPTSDYEFGLFLQNAAVTHGKGRVSAFSDSTCFSNFYMFIPGKPELALGTVEWLNRKESYGMFRVVFAVLFGISFSGIALLYRRSDPMERKKIIGTVLIFSLCACGIAVFFFNTLTRATYPLPRPHTDFKTVSFETEHSRMELPVKKLVDKHPDNFHTFYVWFQRKNYIPALKSTLEDALVQGDMVVIINPQKPFDKRDIRLVTEFLETGGHLLILDGPGNKTSTSAQLLEPFNMAVDFKMIRNATLQDRFGRIICTGVNTGTVKGGRGVVTTFGKKNVFSVKKHGKGRLGVMANARIFANQSMGGTQISPDKKRQRIYQLEFFIIDAMEK